MVEAQCTSDTCQICKQQKPISELIPAAVIRDSIVEEIVNRYPQWSHTGFVCREDLDEFRQMYVQHSIEKEKGELTALETEIVDSMKKQEILSKNLNTEFDSKLTVGQRIADHVAEFGGSWRFIISFGIILVVWIIFNSIRVFGSFDPFPFILLNLVLSMLAALQAPVIMMSQNRQESKDRMRAEHDYQVNMKAELEIRTLTEKMDHLLHQQWGRLLEIQQIQTELMHEMIRKTEASGDTPVSAVADDPVPSATLNDGGTP